jgi:hypothetical protein
MKQARAATRRKDSVSFSAHRSMLEVRVVNLPLTFCAGDCTYSCSVDINWAIMLGSSVFLRQHRLMRTRAVVPLLFAIACSSSDNKTAPDASATPDGSGGATIKISGIAYDLAVGSSGPLAGVVVTAYAKSDESTAVATATSAADGSYTLMVPAGAPLDGFLKGVASGHVDTYLYPPAAISADFSNAQINMVSTVIFGFLPGLARAPAGSETVALEVVESLATLKGVADAVVQGPQGATVSYPASSGAPDTSATATMADGRAFVFVAAAGDATVTATKTGATFKSTTLKVHAGALNTTIVTE